MVCAESMRTLPVDIVDLDWTFAEEMAAIHCEALPDDVLPALGKKFLITYFKLALEHPRQRLFGAKLDGELIGFCHLSVTPMSTAFVLRSEPRTLVDILKLAWRDPKILCRGIGLALSRPRWLRSESEIAFIAVKNRLQGRGVGTQLVTFANTLASRLGIFRIATGTANTIALKMYQTKFRASTVDTRTVCGRSYWFVRWDVAQN
jgi:ribosomal protein S18 acetylase RimI-like enzyme